MDHNVIQLTFEMTSFVSIPNLGASFNWLNCNCEAAAAFWRLFKDRDTSVLASWLKELKASEAEHKLADGDLSKGESEGLKFVPWGVNWKFWKPAPEK